MTTLKEIAARYTGPGKFWVGDKIAEGRVYFGGAYVTVEVDSDELRLGKGSAKAGQRNDVAAALRKMDTGYYIRG
jgi:hypothetical protein